MTLPEIEEAILRAYPRIIQGDDEALDALTFQVRGELLSHVDMRAIHGRIPAEEIGRLVDRAWLQALLLWPEPSQPFCEFYVRRLRRLAGDWFCRERDLLATVMLEEVV